jgi:hypothetical protein
MSCYQVYNKDSIKINEFDDYISCPKSECLGEVVEIDELFLPTIIELNRKGYLTKFCCSGHYYENCPNAYIMFENDISLPNIPNGYAKEIENDGNVTIRHMFGDGHTDSETILKYKYYTEILKNAEITFKWAKKLPDISD